MMSHKLMVISAAARRLHHFKPKTYVTNRGHGVWKISYELTLLLIKRYNQAHMFTPHVREVQVHFLSLEYCAIPSQYLLSITACFRVLKLLCLQGSVSLSCDTREADWICLIYSPSMHVSAFNLGCYNNTESLSLSASYGISTGMF